DAGKPKPLFPEQTCSQAHTCTCLQQQSTSHSWLSCCYICMAKPHDPEGSNAGQVAVGLRWGHTLGHTITKGYNGGGNTEPPKLGIFCMKPQGAQLAEQQAGGAFLFLHSFWSAPRARLMP
ncbi:hypothetical protein LEMLEM_LOCUS22414, partial [Lemmus lemmus]